jgi:hypothetical protein
MAITNYISMRWWRVLSTRPAHIFGFLLYKHVCHFGPCIVKCDVWPHKVSLHILKDYILITVSGNMEVFNRGKLLLTQKRPGKTPPDKLHNSDIYYFNIYRTKRNKIYQLSSFILICTSIPVKDGRQVISCV